KGSKVTFLGYNKPLKWNANDEGFTVKIPRKLRNNPPSEFVWTIKVTEIVKK
ncbi:MAG: alpha-L-fucosidase C-terminal domain-containing protein, partial [Polaribacter sp.]